MQHTKLILLTLLICSLQLATAQVGSLVITEIMQNPAAVGDPEGEYIEIYNPTASPIDLENYVISDLGNDSHTIMSSVVVSAGGYVVLARNADMLVNGGFTADYQYDSFSLSNSDDEVILTDPNGGAVDRVAYDGGPNFPDPSGASMSLNPNFLNAMDNDDGANWCEATSTFGAGDRGTPGAANDMCVMLCIADATISDAGCIGADYVFQVSFTATVATIGGFEVFDVTNNMVIGSGMTSPITVSLMNNTSNTPFDIIVRDASNAMCTSEILTVTPENCSITCNPDLVISGIFDGTRTGGQPKGVELYVINDIPDLSAYGIGSANNGGGSDGEEFSFPADAYVAGDYIYVTTDDIDFNAFFGFNANYISGAVAINGDDAIELFCGGNVVDVFGDINLDGSGEPWEYTDGWAYRDDCTGPDGTTFMIDNWKFSGVNGLEDSDSDDTNNTNATADVPMPIGTYNQDNCAGDCPADLTDADLGGGAPNTIPADTYQVSNTITSSGIVASGTTVVFDARSMITLTPGFAAEAGSTFTAMIGGCAPNVVPEIETRTQIVDLDTRLYPNPTYDQTTIELTLPTATEVTITLFDMNGRALQNLLPTQILVEGEHRIEQTLSNVVAGTYLIQVQAGNARLWHKLMILK
ncbi:MAG: lamin tail domain-containing protein [Bacteroidota bacterium]